MCGCGDRRAAATQAGRSVARFPGPVRVAVLVTGNSALDSADGNVGPGKISIAMAVSGHLLGRAVVAVSGQARGHVPVLGHVGTQ